MTVVFLVFCRIFPEAKARRPGLLPHGRRTPDLRTIQSQLDALLRGIGEDIRQRAKPHVGTAWHGETMGSQQRADLVDGPGDRAVVHAVEHGRRRVGELEAQDDQSSDSAVGEHQLVTGSCSSRTHAAVAPAVVQSPLFRGRPRVCQLADQRAESTALETSEDPMGQGRAGQVGTGIASQQHQLARPSPHPRPLEPALPVLVSLAADAAAEHQRCR